VAELRGDDGSRDATLLADAAVSASKPVGCDAWDARELAEVPACPHGAIGALLALMGEEPLIGQLALRESQEVRLQNVGHRDRRRT
jgi:hypothetical protein